MNFKRILLSAALLFLIIAITLPVVAQTSKGIVAGIVRDKTGAVVSGAKSLSPRRRQVNRAQPPPMSVVPIASMP